MQVLFLVRVSVCWLPESIKMATMRKLAVDLSVACTLAIDTGPVRLTPTDRVGRYGHASAAVSCAIKRGPSGIFFDLRHCTLETYEVEYRLE